MTFDLASSWFLALALAIAACGDDSPDTESDGMEASGSESTASTGTGTGTGTGSGSGSGQTSESGSTSASTGMPTSSESGASTSGSMDVCRACGAGESCRIAACCDDVGYCVADKAPSCGGFVGKVCPEPLVCLLDWCVGDGDGRCVEAARAAELEKQYPGCWNDPE